MKNINGLLILCVLGLTLAGCTKTETKESTDKVTNGTRDVVEATSDAMRSVVEGINDAVYKSKN